MQNNKNCIKKANFDEENYKTYEEKLLSPLTPIPELEKICMALAHDSEKKAQDLLAEFKEK